MPAYSQSQASAHTTTGPAIYRPHPTQEQLDLYFNLVRVFQMIFPPDVQWVSAPLGWQVGMHVPDQYIVPGYHQSDEEDDIK